MPISHLKEYPDNVYMHNGVEAVDLGLSVKWASFNIGNVSVPQNSGIGIKTNFEGDCAQRFWGGSWRMPTEEEFQELIEKCEWDDYYAAVSASVENDEHFIMLLKSTWGME